MKRLLMQVQESCEDCPYEQDIDPYPTICVHPEHPGTGRHCGFNQCPLPESKNEQPTDRGRLGLARGVMHEAIFLLQEGLKQIQDTAAPTEADLVEYTCNDCDQVRLCLPQAFVCRYCLSLAGTLVVRPVVTVPLPCLHTAGCARIQNCACENCKKETGRS